MRYYKLKLGLAIIITTFLISCSESSQNRQALQREAEGFNTSDECHVCGMLITRFPGPKGQAFVEHQQRALKFCSTRDLFAWLLQPETAAIVQDIYVHDMTANHWDKPDDVRLIDARNAWYVIHSDRRGAMGPSLASFASRSAAEVFVARHGGELVPYQDITLDVLN